jgi:hypothetical protein
MFAFDPTAYGPAVQALLAEPRLPPLDPGRPNLAARSLLEALDDNALFAGRPVRDRDLAACCRAGLWLHHNFLDEAHTISQEIETPEGSYWHALMHRREPDFSNSKYWYRRVGAHAVFEPLRDAAVELGYRQAGAAWDAFAFVDACEAALHGRTENEMLCRKVQQREWELLFAYCYRLAAGD